ncbi:putative nwd2 protein [Mycena venus]|uniref:Putative nwd2 protein n=1 Tax=Mycena venus TaxID=2733690 RepID=A0A8H6XYZ6_9AGAR|nr:putative nwd2 protein [Mycena venus]
MFRQASQTIINYVLGGAGGNGGGGGVGGQGGDGGIGEAPTLNYAIAAQNVTMNTHFPNETSGIHILYRSIVVDALYNSSERFPQPRCHPETRTELLEKLYRWATDPDANHSIHWLHGPAGGGKSAVMQTLCERLQQAGRLGGSFFFKRGHSTSGNAKVLFPTLAYQLALHQHKLKGLISWSVETDPSVLDKSLDVQLQNLILEPCKLADNSPSSALLIDGLDECDGHKIQQEILRLIGSAAKRHHLTLRILIASRPEPHIQETFKEDFLQAVADSTNIEQSFQDVCIYLCDEFSRIHREHSAMKNIPTPWPAPEILKKLVQNSSGYFVYAATVIKFVDDEYSWPSKQLDIVVQNLVCHDSASPFTDLDQLYMQILSRVPVQYCPTLCNILCVKTHYPRDFTVQDIDVLLDLKPGTVELIIRPLHSVLKVPALSRHSLRVHHASFLDFLKDEARSLNFHVGSAEYKVKLGHSILKALSYTYDDPWKNLADLEFYWYVEATLRHIPNLD